MTHYKIRIGEKHFDVPSPMKLALLKIVDSDFKKIGSVKKDDENSNEIYFSIGEHIILTVVQFIEPSFSKNDLDASPMFPEDFAEILKTIGTAAGLYKEKKSGEA